MSSIKIKMVALGLVFSMSTMTIGQGLEGTIQQLVETNGIEYISPLVTAFGTGMNSGTFSTANSHKLLGFDVSINAALVSIPSEANTFTFFIPDNIPFSLDLSNDGLGTYDFTFDGNQLYPGARKSSTFFGKKVSNTIAADASYLEGSLEDQLVADGVNPTIAANLASTYASSTANELNILTPVGFDFSNLPTLMPSVSIGLPYDIELTLRGAPEIDSEDIGKVSFIGYGAKIGLNRFIPMDIGVLPRLSVGYYINTLKVGDIIDAESTILNIQASKKLLFLTVYGGYGIESTTVDIDYTHDDGTDVSFTVDGKNENRFLVGARMKMLFFSFNVDYNVGEYNAINAGLSFSFR
ncbi:MAG: hypothetical protein HOB17_02240 [Candidatus Marinimicrobia bacterium]|jgi:hypothetical protein|nr:hypothetical protein [Candidatus Neomarinimicrobiota bacterium]MBT3633083.1 hypothetical protein [Candidatus Neomarinimicrobiota bacterium]MBT3682316.1 hypothetical protein [Candidatus Neomarinimicrobiota bacterium]MBT3758683.1 hypothetical protein [Candidatus Neomarinimicrobiota bacterium]MBT3895443.1 hypothetical protein [Candidatus Neomarinimicrobiota bacterium]